VKVRVLDMLLDLKRENFKNSDIQIWTSPSIRHLSYDDCLEDKREDYQNCSVPYCVTQWCTIICTLL